MCRFHFSSSRIYFLPLQLFISDKETIEKLHVQLHELNEMSRNLKLEMDAYDRLVKQFGISRTKDSGEYFVSLIVKTCINKNIISFVICYALRHFPA